MSVDASSFSVLVSGAGSIGARHLKNLRALGVTQLAVADPSEERRQRVASDLGIVGHADYGEAIAAAKPGIVFICAPTKFHVPQALKAAEAGANLFIEKPLSHAMEGVDALMAEVGRRHLTAMVGCNMRFHPGPATVKALLDRGVIGAVSRARVETASFLPDWRPDQDYRKSYSADPLQGGAILDCIHEIDLALWYLGPAGLERAQVLPATAIGIAVDGEAQLTLRHAIGATSEVLLSFIRKGYERRCEIVGEEGRITWEYGKGVKLYGNDGTLREAFGEPAGWEANAMYRNELLHFFGAVENGAVPMGSLPEGKAALRIALEARRGEKTAVVPSRS